MSDISPFGCVLIGNNYRIIFCRIGKRFSGFINISVNIPFRAVRASKGKIKRAEPIAALYEQGRVHHVGSFDKLEEQMTSYVPSMITASPDRMDALVWGLSELSSRSSSLILA